MVHCLFDFCPTSMRTKTLLIGANVEAEIYKLGESHVVSIVVSSDFLFNRKWDIICLKKKFWSKHCSAGCNFLNKNIIRNVDSIVLSQYCFGGDLIWHQEG